MKYREIGYELKVGDRIEVSVGKMFYRTDVVTRLTKTMAICERKSVVRYPRVVTMAFHAMPYRTASNMNYRVLSDAVGPPPTPAPSKVKLSKVQVDVLALLRDGWQIGATGGMTGRSWIQQGGIGKGGVTKPIDHRTITALEKSGQIVEVIGSHWNTTYYDAAPAPTAP